MLFEILCDNKGSYQIAAVGGSYTRPEYGKPVVLVKCDRDDSEDNNRGLALAKIINDRLNQLTKEEADSLLADSMVPVNWGEIK